MSEYNYSIIVNTYFCPIDIILYKLKINPIIILIKNTNCKYGGNLKFKRIYKKMGYITSKL